MSCIGTISGTLELACGAPAFAFNRIQSAKLINAADIASFTVNSSGGAAITRVTTKRGYDVTTVNDALTINVAMKSQDITAGAFDVTITFKDFAGSNREGFTSAPTGAIDAVARAALVIAVDHGNGVCRVYGLGAPLVCLEYSMDSTTDGYAVFTYGVEDWQVGTTIYALSKADYDALSAPAPSPEPEPEPEPSLNQKENGKRIN